MTIDEADSTIFEARALGLRGADFMSSLGPEKVAAACNGAGPDRWPERARKKLTKWLWLFKTCFDIHDCEFEYGNDGSRGGFDRANDNLEINCRIACDSEYRWYNPMRYVARLAAGVVVDACRKFGWEDWVKAYEKGDGGKTCA